MNTKNINMYSPEVIKKLVAWNNKNAYKILGFRATVSNMKKAINEGLEPFEFISEDDL